MARINIEDSLWRDERFHKLSAAIGKIQACGLVVIAYDLAQKWWSKNPDHVIPVFEWSKTPELKHLVEHGLARVNESGIWVCGAEEGCSFIKKQQENGKKGAAKRWRNSDSQNSQDGPLPLPLLKEENNTTTKKGSSSSFAVVKEIQTRSELAWKLVQGIKNPKFFDELLPDWDAEVLVDQIIQAANWYNDRNKVVKNPASAIRGWLNRSNVPKRKSPEKQKPKFFTNFVPEYGSSDET